MIPSLVSALVCAPYVLAIGVNTPRSDSLSSLKFADDDAASFAGLFDTDWKRNRLLTVFDEDSQEAFQAFARHARPPTLSEVTRAVSDIRNMVIADREQGQQSTVVIFLAGHGDYGPDGHAGFSLQDGRLSRAGLESKVLEPLAVAHRVHLIVDTCFAGALVRARAQVRKKQKSAVAKVFDRGSLSRFANVGAVLATTQGQEAYEWEEIGAGVFSAIVRAALRGSADADGNGEISYQELAAFSAAASQAIPIAKARPAVIAHPPPVDRSAPLIRSEWLNHARPLKAELSKLGRFYVWSGRGRFMTGGRFEPGFNPTLWLPNKKTLYLSSGETTRPLVSTATSGFTLGTPGPSDVKQRGPVGQALAKGLFSASFGPAYYSGFVASDRASPTVAQVDSSDPSLLSAVLYGGAGAMGLASLVAGGIALEAGIAVNRTDLEREAHNAHDRYRVAAIVGTGAAVTAGALLLVALLTQ